MHAVRRYDVAVGIGQLAQRELYEQQQAEAMQQLQAEHESWRASVDLGSLSRSHTLSTGHSSRIPLVGRAASYHHQRRHHHHHPSQSPHHPFLATHALLSSGGSLPPPGGPRLVSPFASPPFASPPANRLPFDSAPDTTPEPTTDASARSCAPASSASNARSASSCQLSSPQLRAPLLDSGGGGGGGGSGRVPVCRGSRGSAVRSCCVGHSAASTHSASAGVTERPAAA